MNKTADLPDAASNGHHRLLALAALIEGDFSIDWLEELSGMKASQILLSLQDRIDQGDLVARRPGVFCFIDPEKRETWRAQFPADEQEQMHRRIADLIMAEASDDVSKAFHPGLLQRDPR